MTARKRNWIIAGALAVVLAIVALVVAASMVAGRIEPYTRQAAIRYLSQRFDSDVQLRTLHIKLPKTSLLHRVLLGDRGITARIEGQDLVLRLKNRPEPVPLFTIREFHCEVDLATLLHPPIVVTQVFVDGMQIHVPPRGEHSSYMAGQPGGEEGQAQNGAPAVMIEKINIQNAVLVLQPRSSQKVPLEFDIQSLQLQSVQAGAPLKYDAALTNAKPPGKIHATGTFGPWQAVEPGDTGLTGDYQFEKADLGVFAGIAGTLDSTGQFEGQLSAITVRGQASVPDFRLRMAGNPVPLFTRFTALVDGTNGNTMLQPVAATLGSTNFTTSGGIIRHEANQPRAISLNVAMPNGNLRDVLRLAMKGSPFMEGRLALQTRIDIPPLTSKVREKLILDGNFQVHEGKFLHSTIQSQIDGLSKRARGAAQNPESDQVVSRMSGAFHMENAAIQFHNLSFGVPGAYIDLTGDYNLDSDALNFDGSLKLKATVSQMVTGWKSILLRPVDRLFERDGVGTFLHIRVDGTSKAPKFGVILAGRRLEAPLPKR